MQGALPSHPLLFASRHVFCVPQHSCPAVQVAPGETHTSHEQAWLPGSHPVTVPVL